MSMKEPKKCQRQRYMPWIYCACGGAAVLSVIIWLYFTESAEQHQKNLHLQQEALERKSRAKVALTVPASLQELKLERPRDHTFTGARWASGKVLVVQNAPWAQDRVATLGLDAGLSPYHPWILPNLRANTKEEIAAVLWLDVQHHVFHNRKVLGAGWDVGRRITLKAALTNLNGVHLSDPAEASRDLLEENPEAQLNTRKRVLDEFGSATKWVIKQLNDQMQLRIWQANVPALDFDRHAEFLDFSRSAKGRERVFQD